MSRDKKAYLRDYKNGVLRIDFMPEGGFEAVDDTIEPAPPQPSEIRLEPKVRVRNNRDQRPPIQGRVMSYNPTRKFGFIATPQGAIFFHEHSIVPDSLGHHCFVNRGADVSLNLNHDGPKGKETYASNVRRPVRLEDDLTTHQEYSQVLNWNGSRGYLKRACNGDSCNLSFTEKDIATLGVEEIQPGDFVLHGVAPRGDGSFKACNVILFEPGFVPSDPEPQYAPGSIEAQFLAAPELPIEPEPAPVPVKPAIYSPAERKLTLRELIQRKKTAA